MGYASIHCPLHLLRIYTYLPNPSLPTSPDRRQERLRQEQAEASGGTGSAAPTRHGTEEMDVDGHPPSLSQAGGGDGEGGKDGKDGKDHASQPPAKRYRMTEQMKGIVWELVLLSNEACRLENEKK